MRLHLSPNGLSKSIVKPGSSARVVYTHEKQDFTLKRDAMMCFSPTRELRAKQILLSQRMGQDSQHLQSERTEVLALYEKGYRIAYMFHAHMQTCGYPVSVHL